MHKLAPSALVIVCSLALSSVAYGFGMTESQGAVHREITKSALAGQLEPLSLANLAGDEDSWGAIGWSDANHLFSAKYHCDGGDYFEVPDYDQTRAEAQNSLNRCRNLIFDEIDEAIGQLADFVNPNGRVNPGSYPTGNDKCLFAGQFAGRPKCNVLEHLGLALHASQDFYSHTNWVDQRVGTPQLAHPDGLQRDTTAPFLSARDGPFPQGLISGCYSSVPGGCGTGLLGPKRVNHDDLNKDGPDTPRGRERRKGLKPSEADTTNFNAARLLAIAETRAKWAYFEAQVRLKYPGRRGEVMLCGLKMDDPLAC